jgi:hypothetical protein
MHTLLLPHFGHAIFSAAACSVRVSTSFKLFVTVVANVLMTGITGARRRGKGSTDCPLGGPGQTKRPRPFLNMALIAADSTHQLLELVPEELVIDLVMELHFRSFHHSP